MGTKFHGPFAYLAHYLPSIISSSFGVCEKILEYPHLPDLVNTSEGKRSTKGSSGIFRTPSFLDFFFTQPAYSLIDSNAGRVKMTLMV